MVHEPTHRVVMESGHVVKIHVETTLMDVLSCKSQDLREDAQMTLRKRIRFELARQYTEFQADPRKIIGPFELKSL